MCVVSVWNGDVSTLSCCGYGGATREERRGDGDGGSGVEMI